MCQEARKIPERNRAAASKCRLKKRVRKRSLQCKCVITLGRTLASVPWLQGGSSPVEECMSKASAVSTLRGLSLVSVSTCIGPDPLESCESAKPNLTGIANVVSRMEWYYAVAERLMDMAIYYPSSLRRSCRF